MGRKVPVGLGLAPGPATKSLTVLHGPQSGPLGVVEGGAIYDLSVLETLEEQQLYASAVHAWGETESGSGRGRYSVAFKVSLILALALCASFSLGSTVGGGGWEGRFGMGTPAQITYGKTGFMSFGFGGAILRGRRMKELEDDLEKALVEFMRRPEHHEPTLKEIVSGVVPDDDTAATSLARALDALHSASESTQRDIVDKHLEKVLIDSEHHNPAQLLEDMVREVQAVAPDGESDPEEADAQSARTALLVAVLEAFTARVKCLEHLGLMAAAAADEEAMLEKEKPGESVGLAHLLEAQGAPEEVVEAAAQQVKSVAASVPQFKARRLLNHIQLSRQKLAGDLEVAAAFLGPLSVGKDGGLQQILEPFESHAVSLMRQHTSLKGREGVMIQVELEEYRLIRDMMKFLEAKGQGKVFLQKASDSLCGVHRLDRACRTGASQRADFWEFLRDHWSAEAHDKLYELLESQSNKFEKHKLGSRSYLASSAGKFLSSYSPKVKQVDVLLLRAAIALL